MGVLVIVLGFIDRFGNETFHMQMDSVSCSTEDTSGCATIASDITYCQSESVVNGKTSSCLPGLPSDHNVSILMSMGGATTHDCAPACKGQYEFDNANQAEAAAEEMYYMFFGGKSSNYTRPFGQVQLDGVDLDIGESSLYSTSASDYQYADLVTRQRKLEVPRHINGSTTNSSAGSDNSKVRISSSYLRRPSAITGAQTIAIH